MKIILLYSLLFISISQMLIFNVVHGQNDLEKPSVAQRFKQIALELGKSSQGSWGKLKSVVYQVQEKFFPPSLDFRRKDDLSGMEGDGKSAAAAKMTDAVEKSLETSESVLEETADTMSKVVGEAVQKTKEKVKETMGDETADGKKDEL